MKKWKNLSALLPVCGILLSGCGAAQFEFDTKAHISQETADIEEPIAPSQVPDLVGSQASIPELSYEGPADLYDIVVSHISVRDILNTLADQSGLNLDIDPFVDGPISMNAKGQTIDQILERIRRILRLRIERIDGTIVIANDEHYIKQYVMTFPDLSRTFTSDSSSDDISSGSASQGSGSISVTKDGTGSVWQDLEEALVLVLDETALSEVDTAGGPVDDDNEQERVESLALRVARPEAVEAFVHTIPDAGLIIVYGNSMQHEIVDSIIAKVSETSRRQVLLQATVVEISLNDNYEHGIDWSVFNTANNHPKVSQGGNALSEVLRRPSVERLEDQREYLEALLGDDEDAVNRSLLDFASRPNFTTRAGAAAGGFFNGAVRLGDVEVAVSLLDQFGDTRVVSSPRVSTLNGQGALLKVVEDRIYFTVDITRERDDAGVETITYETEEETIPVGFTMLAYPQIGSDGTIILYMRPSVSRIVGTALPPTIGNPTAGTSGSGVPITSVKEIETVMLLNDGQIAVLGGLIEDQLQDSDQGIPGAKDLPGIGNLFKNKKEASNRIEYVIFVSADIVTNPSIYGDFSDFRELLPSDETLQRDQTGTFFNKEVARVPRN